MFFVWSQFTIEINTFKTLIADNLVEYAKNVTIFDKKNFDYLCSEIFKTRVFHLIYMNIKWNFFCNEIAKCWEAYLILKYYLDEIIKIRTAHNLVNSFSN